MGNPETDCQALLRRLYEFLDGELDEAACATLQQHLDECPECFKHADFERGIKEFVRRRCAESLPDGFDERLRRAIRET